MKINLSNEAISIYLQILQILIALIGVKFSSTWLFLLVVSISVFSILLFISRRKKYKSYMHFIEFLMNNKIHNFVLLPKLRLFLESEKISNKIKIKEMNVTYKISCSNKEKLIGDLNIDYKLNIENKRIPNHIDFVFGNDYSTENQNMLYKYGDIQDYQEASPRQQIAVPYWRGVPRYYSISFDRHHIHQTDDIKLDMKISCKNSFDFKNLGRDTIICLPKIFSDDIEKIKYEINLSGFQDSLFYCNAYVIYEDKGKFRIAEINCNRVSGSFFQIEFSPNDIIGEKAYYFRVGLNRYDTEQMI